MSPSNVGVHDKWSSASLRIFGEKLRPEQIDAMLGLKATHIHLKGQRRSPRHKAVWRESLWSLRSRLSDDHSIADHLEWLLERLEPKADAIKTLSAEYHLDFFCGFSSDSGQGGFKLDSITLERIAKLGVPLVVDLYPPGARHKASQPM
jgi:hypothetical protein